MRTETGSRGPTVVRRPIARMRGGLAAAGALTVMAAMACSADGSEPDERENSADVSQTGRGDVPTEKRDDLETVFDEAGVEGTFVLHDAHNGTSTVVGSDLARERSVPGPTFELVNSLVALETGEVADVDEEVEHGGSGGATSLREALPGSEVAVQRELAERMGSQDLHTWVDRFDYGNRAMDDENGDGQDWLEGPLEISPLEQTVFLAGLARAELPVQAEHQQALHEVVLREQDQGRSLYATEGWNAETDRSPGWWVGWIEGQESLHTFALRLEDGGQEQMELREPLGRELLAELDVLPA
ncbi:penicillin-binding transpeptidase domain-containing protein [Nocardiopsis xinjiangensis]|uniref:penicillin-binding transpeptidase domain-containing protein n=1 Tax=Nocardiopsis xinjiangensis TaxID=124285 RepID=UPI000348EA7B|nr:penicillin-binding transpeptidase domain-containing protein [Nocardiopsis xinjiangensis]